VVPLTESSALGEGTIDNWIVDSSVHVAVGVAVIVTMTAAAGWAVRLAVAGRVLDTAGRVLVGVATGVLAVQVLLGIKLLDQGQGISQLYIHYLGGMIPLGVFLLTGWWPRPDTPGRTRVFAALVAVGWLSAIMAFTIGRA
jgi:ABC-type maltose transport system permease subunit